jgi:hypothetical protein
MKNLIYITGGLVRRQIPSARAASAGLPEPPAAGPPRPWERLHKNLNQVNFKHSFCLRLKKHTNKMHLIAHHL